MLHLDTVPLASCSLLATLGLTAAMTGCGGSPYTVRPATPRVGLEAPGARAVVIVRVAMPWYAPRFVVRGKFRNVLSEYEQKPALEAKYFSISDDRRFGGLYLWRTRADAERHFDAKWFDYVRRVRGVEANVVTMAAPYVIDGRARLGGELAGARSLAFPASASFVTWKVGHAADTAEAARRLATSDYSEPALVRVFVVTGEEWVGLVSLFATREAAERSVSAERRAALGAALGATSSEYTLFETPLLVDATLRDPPARP